MNPLVCTRCSASSRRGVRSTPGVDIVQEKRAAREEAKAVEIRITLPTFEQCAETYSRHSRALVDLEQEAPQSMAIVAIRLPDEVGPPVESQQRIGYVENRLASTTSIAHGQHWLVWARWQIAASKWRIRAGPLDRWMGTGLEEAWARVNARIESGHCPLIGMSAETVSSLPATPYLAQMLELRTAKLSL